MRLRHALAGVPALVLLSSAVVMAWGTSLPATVRGELKGGTDVGLTRTALMAESPIGTPVDAAMRTLQQRGLACRTSEPPLANVTWRVVECSRMSSVGVTLQVDVAGRNGVVADIGVEDRACMVRADATNPTPRPVDCDMSSKRLLDVEAAMRGRESVFLADLLGSYTLPTGSLGRQGNVRRPLVKGQRLAMQWSTTRDAP